MPKSETPKRRENDFYELFRCPTKWPKSIKRRSTFHINSRDSDLRRVYTHSANSSSNFETFCLEINIKVWLQTLNTGMVKKVVPRLCKAATWLYITVSSRNLGPFFTITVKTPGSFKEPFCPLQRGNMDDLCVNRFGKGSGVGLGGV